MQIQDPVLRERVGGRVVVILVEKCRESDDVDRAGTLEKVHEVMGSYGISVIYTVGKLVYRKLVPLLWIEALVDPASSMGLPPF